MTVSATAYPLQWPESYARTPSHRRTTDRFSVTFAGARDRLYAELERMGATSCVISSMMPLKLNGEPSANAGGISDPGVELYFARRGLSLTLACDRFHATSGNLRAIGLSIAAMRSLERYGCSDLMERAFTGFAALPAPVPASGGRSCWDILGIPTGSAEEIRAAYIAGAKRLHPDLGGNPAQMAELNAARDQALREVMGV